MKNFCKMTFLTLFAFVPGVFAATDGEMATALRRGNDIELEAAQTAIVRATNSEVKNFAQKVIDDGSRINRELAELLSRQAIKTDLTQDSISFIFSETNKVKSWADILSTQSQYEKAYVDSQVEIHRAQIANLENNYIPNAQNPEFKTYLEKIKTDFQERLTRVQQLQTSLANQ